MEEEDDDYDSDDFSDDDEDEEERGRCMKCLLIILFPIRCCLPCGNFFWMGCFRPKVEITVEMLDRLREVYVNNGGLIIDSNQFDRKDDSGLDPFESLCFDVNTKLDWIDKRIKVYQEKRRKSTTDMELSLITEGIEAFLRSVRKDERNLREIHKNFCEQTYISYYDEEYHIGMNKREIHRRNKLLESIKTNTILFQDDLDKDVKTARREAAKARVKAEMEREDGDDDMLHISEDDQAPSSDEEGIDDDYEEGYVIKVQFIARKIKALRKKSEEYMAKINDNLEELLDISKFTKKKLEEGNKKLFEDLIPKTESIIDLQEKCKKKLDTAAQEASGQVKWIICAISIIVILLFCGLGFVALAVVIASF